MRLLAWAAAAVCVRALQVDDAPPRLHELDFTKDDPLPPTQQKFLDGARTSARSQLARAINYKDLEFHIDHQGYRPLHLAAQQGEADAVRDLLRLGADANARLLPSAPTGPVTVLHVAAQWGRVDIVRQLVRDGGAKIDPVEGPSSDDVKTPLVLALRHGHSNTARALIDLGADLSIISTGGWTPLATAANHGNVELVKKLIKAGAKPSQRVGGGFTALHCLTVGLPVAEWSAGCLVALYQGGADLDARDHNGRTLLFIAASRGSDAFVEFLTWLGADATIGNKDGVLPAEIAEENGHAFTVGEIDFRHVYARLIEEGHDGLTAITLADSFLDRGADIDEPTGEDAMTSLAFACAEDRRDLIGLFVSHPFLTSP